MNTSFLPQKNTSPLIMSISRRMCIYLTGVFSFCKCYVFQTDCLPQKCCDYSYFWVMRIRAFFFQSFGNYDAVIWTQCMTPCRVPRPHYLATSCSPKNV